MGRHGWRSRWGSCVLSKDHVHSPVEMCAAEIRLAVIDDCLSQESWRTSHPPSHHIHRASPIRVYLRVLACLSWNNGSRDKMKARKFKQVFDDLPAPVKAAWAEAAHHRSPQPCAPTPPPSSIPTTTAITTIMCPSTTSCHQIHHRHRHPHCEPPTPHLSRRGQIGQSRRQSSTVHSHKCPRDSTVV